ncbi:hypothetical protein QTP88_013189 [Uroleucon formosanum]
MEHKRTLSNMTQEILIFDIPSRFPDINSYKYFSVINFYYLHYYYLQSLDVWLHYYEIYRFGCKKYFANSFTCLYHFYYLLHVPNIEIVDCQVVLLSIEMYRHRDRSIEHTYTNDPFVNKSYWPMGFGQLTSCRIEKQFKLGKWLKKPHSGWLSEVNSAEDHMESGKHIQLVPINTVPKSIDNLLSMSESCPLYSQEMDKVVNDFEIQTFHTHFSSLFESMEKNRNLQMGKKSHQIYYFNYTLPKWTKSIFFDTLLTIVKENAELEAHTNTLKRLKTGPLLNEIVTHMYEKKNGTQNPNRMLWVYSAHDTTIVNLLNAFELYEHLLALYAAVLMIELRLNSTGNYVVKVNIISSNHEPYLLHVPGCDSVACELDIFIDVLRPLISGTGMLNYLSDIKTIIVIMLVSYVIAGKILSFFKKKSGCEIKDLIVYSNMGKKQFFLHLYNF